MKADRSITERRVDMVIVIALTIAAAITRLYGIAFFPLFDDEVTSFFRGLNNEINPVYPASDFLIIASFKLIGTSEFALRFPLAVFGVLGVPVIYIVTRRLFDAYSGLAAALLVLFSYYHLDHSQLTRYYVGPSYSERSPSIIFSIISRQDGSWYI